MNRGNGWPFEVDFFPFTKRNPIPQTVKALTNIVIVDVCCGGHHTCVVTSTGSIITWGYGHGTGHGHIGELRILPDISSKGVISVHAGYQTTACITKSGELYFWGVCEGYREPKYQLPERVEGLDGVKVKHVACAISHTVICTEDGHVYTFGIGKSGRLGHGDRDT